MGNIGNMAAKFTADTAEFDRPVEQSTNRLLNFTKTIKAAQMEDRKSGVTATESFLKGAGAAAIFTFAGEKLNQALDKIGEVQKKVAEGSLSTAEGIEEVGKSLIESIPVAGQFFDAGMKIHGMLTGETAALEEYEESQKKAAEAVKLAIAQDKTYHEGLKIGLELQSQLGNQQRLASASGTIGGAAAVEVAIEAEEAAKKIQEAKTALDKLPQTSAFTIARNNLSQLIAQLEKAKDAIGQTKIDSILGGMAVHLDSLARSEADLNAMKIAALGGTEAQQDLARAIGKTSDAIEKISAAKSMQDLTDTSTAAASDLLTQLKSGAITTQQWATAMDALRRTGQKTFDSLRQSAIESAKALHEQVENFGKTPAQMALKKAEGSGLTPAEVAGMKADQTKLDALEKRAKMQEAYNHLLEQAKSPAEQLEDKLSELDKLYAAGIIPNAETYNQLAEHAAGLDEKDKKSRENEGEFRVVDRANIDAHGLSLGGRSRESEIQQSQLELQRLMERHLAMLAHDGTSSLN